MVEALSSTQIEVLGLFAQGKSTDEVARLTGLAASTVMFHYRSVAARYGTLNRTQTVVEAIRRGDIAMALPTLEEMARIGCPIKRFVKGATTRISICPNGVEE